MDSQMDNQMNDRTESLLIELMTVDFAVIELNLYLDTHPNDVKALEMYNMYVQKSKELRDRYEMLCGPLTARYSKSPTPWKWIKNPWPWNRNFIR